MTTAHRPTFDPARGKEAQRGVAYHQRLMPAHTQLKTRKPGQGGDADPQVYDLKAQLLEAETAHFAKSNPSASKEASTVSSKRQLEAGPGEGADGEEEDMEAKRRRVLAETRDIDAASNTSESESSEEDSDEEDETAELLRELEKIKRERAEKKEQEVVEKTEPMSIKELTLYNRSEREQRLNRINERTILHWATRFSYRIRTPNRKDGMHHRRSSLDLSINGFAAGMMM